MNLSVIVSAATQAHQILITEMRNKLRECRLRPKEVLTDICATSNGVLLELTVNGAVHLAHQVASFICCKEWVPLACPDHLDHIPASTTEETLELLHDLPVSAHRTVKALQIAVHHPGEVVEPLSRSEGECACRLRLVHLAIAEEGPDPTVRGISQSTIVQIAVVSGLIDRSDPAEAHGYRWELPEVWKEARVRVRREAAGPLGLLAESIKLRLPNPPLKEGARVDPWGRVSLVEDLVARAANLATEEVVEADLIEAGRTRVRCKVATDPRVFLIGTQHHRRRIPAHDVPDARLHRLVAREARLVACLDGVDVRRGRKCGEIHAKITSARHQAHHQEAGTLRSVGGDRALELGDQARRIGGICVGDLLKEVEGLHCPPRVARRATMWG